MKVIGFDIDGTLLDSSAVDSELYLNSVRHVLGDVKLRRRWSDYERVTDQGLLRSIIRDNGLVDDRSLIARVKDDFFRSLEEHLRTHGPFEEIPGARDFVCTLQRTDESRIVYATGGWRASARLKLQASGFPLDGIPLASSDDHDDRPSIMKSAVSALPGKFSRIIYYGDGVWDEIACKELGWEFVAVGRALGGIERYD